MLLSSRHVVLLVILSPKTNTEVEASVFALSKFGPNGQQVKWADKAQGILCTYVLFPEHTPAFRLTPYQAFGAEPFFLCTIDSDCIVTNRSLNSGRGVKRIPSVPFNHDTRVCIPIISTLERKRLPFDGKAIISPTRLQQYIPERKWLCLMDND